MARQCDGCGKILGLFDSSYTVLNEKYHFCDSCCFRITESASNFTSIIKEKVAKPEEVSDRYDKFVDNIKNAGFSQELTSSLISDADALLSQYNKENDQHLKETQEEKAEREEQIKRTEEEERKKANALSSMLITSGFTFDGYRIVKYSGYISGDDAIQVNRGVSGLILKATNVGDSLMSSLTQIRRNALAELKEAAYDLGCNAVIGVDFDYITLEPETANISGGTTYLPYVFGVTATAPTAVTSFGERCGSSKGKTYRSGAASAGWRKRSPVSTVRHGPFLKRICTRRS
jgi:uncharacterized protein YbjQ (UPF0145 family)